MTARWLRGLPVCLILLATACGSGQPVHRRSRQLFEGTMVKTSAGMLPRILEGSSVRDHGVRSVRARSHADVTIQDSYFVPTFLVGRPGQVLTIDLSNEGGLPHTFTLPGQHIDRTLEPGQRAEVTVTFPRHGAEPWMCRFHKDGMLGALVVNP